MPSQPRRRNKLPHPSTPLLLLFHIKRFAQQNLAAGGIHFRRGYSFPVRGPRKMPRHFVGTDKSSWMSCILPSQHRRRNKLPITSKRSGRCPLLFRLSKKPRRVRGPQAANRVPSIFRGGMYVAKNTLRGESVFVGACAHGRAGRSEIPFVKKGRRPFLTSSRGADAVRSSYCSNSSNVLFDKHRKLPPPLAKGVFCVFVRRERKSHKEWFLCTGKRIPCKHGEIMKSA